MREQNGVSLFRPTHLMGFIDENGRSELVLIIEIPENRKYFDSAIINNK